MALVNTLKFGNTVVEVYDDYVPENVRDNLKKVYDVVNDIAKNLDPKVTENWFYTHEEIENMKKSGKYEFI